VLQTYSAGLNLVEGFRAHWLGVYADPNHMAMDLAIIVPLEPLPEGAAMTPAEPAESHRHGAGGGGRWITFFGIGLVLLGSLALVGSLLPNVATWRYLGPLFIIGMGAVLVVGATHRDAAAPATVPPPPSPPSSLPPSSVPPEEPTKS